METRRTRSRVYRIDHHRSGNCGRTSLAVSHSVLIADAFTGRDKDGQDAHYLHPSGFLTIIRLIVEAVPRRLGAGSPTVSCVGALDLCHPATD